MAREAGITIEEETEDIQLEDQGEGEFLFTVPTVTLSHQKVAQISPDRIG